MPISSEEWEQAEGEEGTKIDQILDLLDDNQDQAYLLGEIIDEIQQEDANDEGGYPDIVETVDARTIMYLLVYHNRVGSKEVNGETYFCSLG